MKTILTKENITAIIIQYLNDQDAGMNFMLFTVDEDGIFDGCVLDHAYEIQLPELTL